ncbi:MAG: superoxide dismutase [Pseudonocardiales bacterium]|nr:MAG: superoxide dismutase [Pseudonocardiales bacterium]
MTKSVASVAAAAAASVVLMVGGTASASPVRATGVFGESAGAYTYNSAFVPVGSRAHVHAVATGAGTTVVTLHAYGLLPDREYGAHAHVANCGPLPTDAGKHFQYVQGGASDPAFANPDNEIWLDFTTDDEGNGQAMTVLDWQFPADRRAHSVVIHDHHTATASGTAGTAGPRYACLTVAF